MRDKDQLERTLLALSAGQLRDTEVAYSRYLALRYRKLSINDVY